MAAEGTGTNVALQEEAKEPASAPPYQPEAAPQYAQLQQQQPVMVQQPLTQVVVVPNAQQTVQTTTYSTAQGNNVAQFGVAGSLVNTNLNYFQPREDTGVYEENMKPWENDGQNYSFACCTEYSDSYEHKKGKKVDASANVQWIHTVYHKTGSSRLIIKRKAGTSAFAQAKNNPMTKWGLGVAALGILLIIIGALIGGGDDDDGYVSTDSYGNPLEEEGGGNGAQIGVIVGGVVLLLAAFVLLCCFQKAKVTVNDSDMVTQSIPIASIFYVERHVSQESEAKQCCCAPPEKQGTQYSEISIGYNRSNLSVKLQAGASTEDHVTFSLISNQAYNLHQYINCIIDGTHPQTNGDVAPGSGASALPRTSSAVGAQGIAS